MASTSLPMDSATAVEVEAASSRHVPKTTIILIRHGARYDYADQKRWKERCEALALEPSDPPLSALGHRQARETAAAVDAARDMNMYLDDFECCKAACGEAC